MLDVYGIILDRVLAILAQGVIPWRKPWKGGETGLPANLVSRKAYQGINVWMLAMQRYPSRFWLTFNQARKMGGFVRKGEKGTPIVYWNWTEKTQADGSTKKVGFLRYYTVFNVTQCDGIPVPDATQVDVGTFDPIPACQSIVDGMPDRPVIQHAEQAAWYKPATDTVNLPKPETFVNPAEYYSTAFHELGHSTGHHKRLDRDSLTPVMASRHEYSKEELIAEMTAAYLCGIAGIEAATLDNSAAYIQNWMKVLKDDPRMLVSAAGQAQKAADFILDRKPAEEQAAE